MAQTDGFVPRPEPQGIEITASITAPAGVLRITGVITVPGEQRLSDFCNRAEQAIALSEARTVLRGPDGEVPQKLAGTVHLNPAEVDVICTAERRRSGDPSLRLPRETRAVRIVTRGGEVVGTAAAPSETSVHGHLFSGRTRFITLSPAEIESESVALCLVNRTRVIAIADDADGPVPRAEACSRVRCERPATTTCGYTDATGAVCGTSWCDAHSRQVGQLRCCERHGDVVEAIAAARGTLGEFGPPLVTDRTMSLTEFMFRTLDEPLQAILGPIRDQVQGAVLSVDQSVRPQFIAGQLVWERGWGVAVPQGYVARVLLRVPLGEPPVLSVLVNRREVFTGVPDWIAARLRGGAPTEAEQEAFAAALVNLIGARIGFYS